LDTRDDVDYTGMDILKEIIDDHQRTFANRTMQRFVVGDIIRDGLKEKYDLVLCRHLLHNIFTRDAMLMMAEISRSGSSYFLVSSYPKALHNVELEVGNVRRVRYMNHEAPPMSLAPPLCYFQDGNRAIHSGQLVLWKLPLKRVKGCKTPTKMKIDRGRLNNRFDYYSCGNWSV